MEVGASAAEPEPPTTTVRHGRRGDDSSNAMPRSPPRKVRKRLRIHSAKKEKEEELLGLDWLQLVGAPSNTTTRDIPSAQVLRCDDSLMCFPLHFPSIHQHKICGWKGRKVYSQQSNPSLSHAMYSKLVLG